MSNQASKSLWARSRRSRWGFKDKFEYHIESEIKHQSEFQGLNDILSRIDQPRLLGDTKENEVLLREARLWGWAGLFAEWTQLWCRAGEPTGSAHQGSQQVHPPTVGVNTQNIQPRGPSYRIVATLISSTERDCKVHLKTWSFISKIQICALAPLHGHLFTPDVFQKTPDLLNQKLIGKNSIYLSNLQNTVNAHKSRPLPREQRS